jgi:ABC-2 type transport system ATP-binding protein
VFDTLEVQEVVAHFAGFYPAPLDPGAVVEAVGLAEKRRSRCGKLSGGQKRRVDLALGLVGDPALVFLDEPTTGLDPEGRRQLWEVIRGMVSLRKTVLLTTHYLDEAEALSTRVGVIIGGELVDVGAASAIGGRDCALTVVRFQPWPGMDPGNLPELPGEVDVSFDGVTVRTEAPTAVVAKLGAWAAAAGVEELPGLSVARPSLEETYLAMVRERQEAAP